jgi:hypothetical protein
MVIRFLTIFLFMVCAIQSQSQSKEEKKIKDVFNGYKNAIMKGKGEEAVKFVDRNTITYYQDMLNTALDGDSAKLAALPVIDKLTVFTIRHKVPKADVESSNGRDFFIYAINNGMVGKNSVAAIELSDVEVSGDKAKASVQSLGQKTPLHFEFNNEDGAWKLDITSIFAKTNEGIGMMLEKNEMTELDFVFKALESLTGKPVDNSIWQPMR